MGFVALLLISAGMVTTPGRGAAESAARALYRDHRGVIVTAQVIGLLAAAAFAAFALTLQRPSTRQPWLTSTGLAVAGAAGLTAVPVLWLTAIAASAHANQVRSLLLASDLADVLLFSTISAFAVVVALSARARWLQGCAITVAVLAAARAVLLLTGSSLLEVVAPLAFVVLVVVLSVVTLARRPLFGSQRLPAQSVPLE